MIEVERPAYYGIIPAKVRYHEDLSFGARLMYAEFSALCNKEGYCWASNAYFANLYGMKPASISEWVSSLKKAGFITVEIFQDKGNSRRITLRDLPMRSSEKTEEGYSEKTESSRKNSTSKNTTINREAGFDTFWKAYPKKLSKGVAEKAWKKVGAELLPAILKAIESQKQSEQWKKEGGTYIPYPASWLNGKMWEDDLTALGGSKKSVVKADPHTVWTGDFWVLCEGLRRGDPAEAPMILRQFAKARQYAKEIEIWDYIAGELTERRELYEILWRIAGIPGEGKEKK
jgi:hypothetical protein